jgi:hypothetical protein
LYFCWGDGNGIVTYKIFCGQEKCKDGGADRSDYCYAFDGSPSIILGLQNGSATPAAVTVTASAHPGSAKSDIGEGIGIGVGVAAVGMLILGLVVLWVFRSKWKKRRQEMDEIPATRPEQKSIYQRGGIREMEDPRRAQELDEARPIAELGGREH